MFFHVFFEDGFVSLFNRFWVAFGTLLELIFTYFLVWELTFSKKSTLRPIRKNHCFFMLFALLGDPEAIKLVPKSCFFSQRFLVSNFNGFCMTFGPLLEPFGSLKDLQIRPKSASFSGPGPRRSKSMILGPFWTDFRSISGSF